VKLIYFVLTGFLLSTALSCTQKPEVVVYTAHDQIYSEPIIREFEARTGISVRTVYDTEASKTVGLVNRLIAEKGNPQCDVFWNNEFARSVVLKRKGVLAPYRSPSASGIPDRYKDPEGYWTGFAARARVIIYNTELVTEEEAPHSIFDLTADHWQGDCTIAKPLFGTTSTHAAALFLVLGHEGAENYFSQLKNNGVIIVDGNATVKNLVADGETKMGLTDTDDANMALIAGKPVKIVFPDQHSIGTLVIPNTVALIANAPHPQEAKHFIDYLLTPEVEEKLAFSKAAQIPLRDGVKSPDNVPSVKDIRAMDVDYAALADMIEETALFVKETFLR
jgi:iron(III) transport system substrate-binding protein